MQNNQMYPFASTERPQQEVKTGLKKCYNRSQKTIRISFREELQPHVPAEGQIFNVDHRRAQFGQLLLLYQDSKI